MMLGVLAIASTLATSELHPRTPVPWPDDTPCMTVVDRSQSAVLHLAYEIPFEDVDISEGEVADSRRNQFGAPAPGLGLLVVAGLRRRRPKRCAS